MHCSSEINVPSPPVLQQAVRVRTRQMFPRGRSQVGSSFSPWLVGHPATCHGIQGIGVGRPRLCSPHAQTGLTYGRTVPVHELAGPTYGEGALTWTGPGSV